ncbi:MAG: DUF3137 domain-containing protein [Muribaculaceae bacterium]|nr:DUF3137 domain-containing protein [Muribaculaceae bacterium]
MTIPRLTNTGSSSKIHVFSAPESVPPVVDELSPDFIPTPVDDSTQPSENMKVNGSDEQSATSVDSHKPNSKEYSIEQFRKDYEEIVVNRVLPELRQYETERKIRLTGAVIAAVICSILALLMFFGSDVDGDSVKAAGFFIGLAFVIWSIIKKSFENKIKSKVLPVLMRAVPGFYWQQSQTVKDEDICSSKIIGFAYRARASYDDNFIGDYRGVPVAIAECEYEIGNGKSSKTIFQGVVIRIKMNKNFEGTTLIRAKKAYNADKKELLKKQGLSEVHLEDPEFEKRYLIFANDQVEARYLITTAFMERLKNIRLAFNAKHISCSFHEDSVYIAPHTGKDLFSLCSLVKPVDNHEQFTVLFNEFVSILELVDHFKLDKKLGL